MPKGIFYNHIMPSSSVVDEMQRAVNFGRQSEGLIIGKGKFTIISERTPFLMGQWSLTFEIHKAIVSLVSAELPGAAFALLRPIVESTIRAHVALMCSDETLQKLRDDSYRTNFGTVGKEIDDYFGTDTLMQEFLRDTKQALHSFAHMGAMQLRRRFAGGDLAPNYLAQELIGLIRSTTSAVFMVNNVATKHFGFEQEWKRNNELFAEWAQRSGPQ